jgi:hypothetical protein
MYKKNLPKDYFKKLQNQIIKNVHDIDDSSEVNAPILSRINKVNLYNVPNNYFAINERNILKNHITKTRFLAKNIMGIAASLLIMISISWVVFNNTNQIELAAELDETVFIDYLIENTDDLDNATLITLNEDKTNNEQIDFEEISNDELSNYIETIVDDISIEDLAIINI